MLRWASLLLACSCAAPDAVDATDPIVEARAFIDDVGARRRALEESIAVAETPYGELRRAHYSRADGTGWEALPVASPRVRTLRTTDAAPALDEGPVAPVDALATLEEWERAGALVFDRYPAQLDLALEPLRDRAIAERAGLDVASDGTITGAIDVETPVGWRVALTCGACHSATREGRRIVGVGSDLDLGGLLGAPWPRGTVDVTNDRIDDPLRPSDLRPITRQARLQHTGNLANGRLARMVRVETLLVTQSGERTRPDRTLVAALALYLESLARTLPEPVRDSAGARAFASTCAGCHRGEDLSGPPVDVALVVTDARSTMPGAERATGGYRAPSLLGVGDRRGLLHDGSAADLEALLGLVPSAHAGHPFGRALDEATRREIAAFLRSSR